MYIDDNFCVMQGDVTCMEHGSKAQYLLNLDYGSVLIPMCQTCIDELYEELSTHVSKTEIH